MAYKVVQQHLLKKSFSLSRPLFSARTLMVHMVIVGRERFYSSTPLR
jgi:hypothetical protein